MPAPTTPYDDVTIAEVSSDEYDNDGVVVRQSDGREITAFITPDYASGVDQNQVAQARDYVVAFRSASVMETLAESAKGIVAAHTGGSPAAMDRLEAEFRSKLGAELGQSVADLLRTVLDGQAVIHREVPFVALDRTDEEDDEDSPAP